MGVLHALSGGEIFYGNWKSLGVGTKYVQREVSERNHNKKSGYFKYCKKVIRSWLNLAKFGLNRDLNPGPPAPKAGIIPLDH